MDGYMKNSQEWNRWNRGYGYVEDSWGGWMDGWMDGGLMYRPGSNFYFALIRLGTGGRYVWLVD